MKGEYNIILKNILPGIIGAGVLQIYSLINLFWLSKVNTFGVATITIFTSVFWFFESWFQTIDAPNVYLISNNFGSKNIIKAKEIFIKNIISAIFLSFILFLIWTITFNSILEFMNVKNMMLINVTKFSKIACYNILILPIILIFYSTLRSTGTPNLAMTLLLILGGVNLLLDPILIFGFWKIKPMGVQGAGFALIFSHIIALIAGVYFFTSGKSKIQVHNLREVITLPKKENLSYILKLGLPAAFYYLIVNTSVLIIVGLMNRFSYEITSIFGVQVRIILFISIISRGYASGIGPIIGNYIGAKKKDLNIFINKTTSIIFIINFIISLIIYYYSSLISKIFFHNEHIITLSTKLNKFMAIYTFLFCMITFFQIIFIHVGHAKKALYLNLISLVLIEIPVITSSIFLFNVNVITFFIILILTKSITFIFNFLLFQKLQLLNSIRGVKHA